MEIKYHKFWIVNSCNDLYSLSMSDNHNRKDGLDKYRDYSFVILEVINDLSHFMSMIKSNGTITKLVVERMMPREVSNKSIKKMKSYRMPMGYIFVDYLHKDGKTSKSCFHITRISKELPKNL